MGGDFMYGLMIIVWNHKGALGLFNIVMFWSLLVCRVCYKIFSKKFGCTQFVHHCTRKYKKNLQQSLSIQQKSNPIPTLNYETEINLISFYVKNETLLKSSIKIQVK